MSKKIKKEEEVPEYTIDAFLEKVKNQNGKNLGEITKTNYKDNLKRFEKESGKTINFLIDNQDYTISFIQNLKYRGKINTESSSKKHFNLLCKFANTFDLDCSAIKAVRDGINDKVQKEELDGTYEKIQTIKIDFENKIKEIGNVEHRLLFMILYNFAPLRNDLAFVKREKKEDDTRYFDKENGTLVFEKINKVDIKTPIIWRLTQEMLTMMDEYKSDTEYLFNIPPTDRTNGYTFLIKRLTLRYFGQEITQTNLRHYFITDLDNKTQHLSKKQQLAIQKEAADRMGHSLETHLSYIQETTDVNINIDKEVINIKANDGTVLETFTMDELLSVKNKLKELEDINNFLNNILNN